jgi:Cft2 family RNA processing exonuclease
MKKRNGFVSNSSSSSFIVNSYPCLEEKDKVKYSVDEIKNQLKDLLKIYNKFFKSNLQFEDVFDVYEFTGNPHDGWEDTYNILTENIDKPRIFIDSIDDNSIPYELFEWIEKKYFAYSCHLG